MSASIARNFAQYPRAEVLRPQGRGADEMAQLARELVRQLALASFPSTYT